MRFVCGCEIKYIFYYHIKDLMKYIIDNFSKVVFAITFVSNSILFFDCLIFLLKPKVGSTKIGYK